MVFDSRVVLVFMLRWPIILIPIDIPKALPCLVHISWQEYMLLYSIQYTLYSNMIN